MPTGFYLSFALLASPPLFAAEAADPFLDLFPQANKEVTARDLERKAKKIPELERLAWLSVGLELHEHHAEIVKLLDPWLAKHPAIDEAQSPLAAMLSAARLRSGAMDKAQEPLERIRRLEKDSPLSQAELKSVEILLSLQRQEWENAEKLLKETQAKLKSGKQDYEGKNWRQKLVEHRLAGVPAAIKRGKALAAGGEIYADWLEVDQKGQATAYQDFAKKHPKTLFAAAATLEEAQLLVDDNKPEDALRLLKKAELEKSRLAAAAALVQGDALVLGGKLKEAAAAYDAAITALRQPAPAEELPEALRALIALPEALIQRPGSSGHPQWQGRPRGRLLDPGLSPHASQYLRYQALIKRSSLAYAAGKRDLAMQLSRSILLISPVDREMDAQECGAPALCLTYMWEDCEWQIGKFLFDIEAYKGAPPELLAQLYIASAYYQCYDGTASLHWVERALADKRLKGFPRDAACVLASCIYDCYRHDRKKELDYSAQVQLRSGQKPNRVWWIARFNECEHGWPEDKKWEDGWHQRVAAWQKIRDQAPGTEYAKEALESQALQSLEIATALKYLEEHKKLYPDDTRAIQRMLSDIEDRKKTYGPEGYKP